MTHQPFTLSWTRDESVSGTEADSVALSTVSPLGKDYIKQLKASLRSETLYSRGALLTSLTLLAACGGGGGGGTGGGGTPPPPPPTNSAPVPQSNSAPAIQEDTTTALNLTAPTDADAGDTLTITVDAVPTNGDILNGTVVVTQGTTLTVAEFEGLQFRPTPDVNGPGGSFNYSVSDGTTTVTGTVSGDFTITAVPDAPSVPANITLTIPEDQTTGENLGIPVITDPDGDALDPAVVTGVPAASAGEVRLNGTVIVNGDTIAIADLPSLEFFPAADFDGTSSFSYTVTDSTGQSASQTITFSITGSPDAPTVDPDVSFSADVGTTQNLGITEPSDPDTGDTIASIVVDEVPVEGEIQKADGTAVAQGDTLTPEEVAGLRFATEAGDSTGGAGAFTYTVTDGTGSTASQTITLSLTSGSFSLDAGTLNGQNGFVIDSEGNIPFGDSVAGGGDVNGDGIDDIIVGAPDANNVFVFFGGAITTGTFDPLDPNAPAGTPRLEDSAGQIFSGNFGTNFGASVDIGPDVNGDGIADLIIGAPNANVDGDVDAGEAYVVFGSSDFGGAETLPNTNTVLIANGNPDALDGTDGFRFISENSTSLAGTSVAFIGDVNNDDIEDMAFGLPGEDIGTISTTDDQGQISLVYGEGDDFAATVTNTSPSATFTSRDDVLSGARDGSETGQEIAGLGDVNGDGIDDFIVGAPSTFATAPNNFGEAFVVFGDADGDFDTDLAGYGNGTSAGFRVINNDSSATSGLGVVAGAGDFNNDGVNDILIGAPGSDVGGNAGAGEVFLIFGQSDGTFSFGNSLDVNATTLAAADGVEISGVGANSGLGSEIASIGDFNGDGIDDFAVAAPGEDGGNGAVYIVYGREDFSGGVDLSTTDSSSHIVITGDTAGLGQSIDGAGDANSDGLSDIVIGADDTVYVLYGFSNGATAATTMSESVLALDGGIALPEGSEDTASEVPLTASAEAIVAEASAGAGSVSTGAMDSAVIASDDIDLSGIA